MTTSDRYAIYCERCGFHEYRDDEDEAEALQQQHIRECKKGGDEHWTGVVDTLDYLEGEE